MCGMKTSTKEELKLQNVKSNMAHKIQQQTFYVEQKTENEKQQKEVYVYINRTKLWFENKRTKN